MNKENINDDVNVSNLLESQTLKISQKVKLAKEAIDMIKGNYSNFEIKFAVIDNKILAMEGELKEMQEFICNSLNLI